MTSELEQLKTLWNRYEASSEEYVAALEETVERLKEQARLREADCANLEIDESIDVLRQLQNWIKSVGTEYETPPPPQSHADAAIQNVVAEVEAARILEAYDLEVKTTLRAEVERLKARIEAALACINERRRCGEIEAVVYEDISKALGESDD